MSWRNKQRMDGTSALFSAVHLLHVAARSRRPSTRLWQILKQTLALGHYSFRRSLFSFSLFVLFLQTWVCGGRWGSSDDIMHFKQLKVRPRKSMTRQSPTVLRVLEPEQHFTCRCSEDLLCQGTLNYAQLLGS